MDNDNKKVEHTGGRVGANNDQGLAPAGADGGPKAGGTAPAAKRFAAFISYAHADEGMAARLHKDIETYRLPGQLHGASGGAPAGRLGKVFRDRADLAAADSLNEAIREALAQSAALIVLCSPAAVQSRWVNEEIRLFRNLNPGAPVLAAVVRGEPAEAMPAALTEDGREPLAADLRQEGDGKKLGFLKIIAALAGVPLDALIQRDGQRKLRRVMAVTVGALIALLAAVTMMTYAIQQRNEADRQREQAEGLVEFMLTDLRERLRGVGRVEIMRSAASRALDRYQSGRDTDSLSPANAARLARVLIAVGEDDFTGGEISEAETAFRTAHRNTATLLAAHPDDADIVFAHAQSEFWIGRIYLTRNDVAHARPYWERYHALAVRLNRLEPDSPRALAELAYGQGNLCTLEQVEQRSGIVLCQEGYETLERLLRLQPNDEQTLGDIANRSGWLADALQRTGDMRAADRFRDRQLEVSQRLFALDRRNWDNRESLVRALYSVASSRFHRGSMTEGSRLAAEAADHMRAMRAHDSDNQQWIELEALVARIANR